jgi:hypothetical protein
VLKGIRENEPRAISLGYKSEQYKLIAFALSATLSGLAGGTKAIVFQLASLTDVHWTMSGEVVLMTLLGGLGTVFGPVAGAFVVIALENYLAQLGAWVTVVQGAIFVVCVLTFRRGLVGELARILKRVVDINALRALAPLPRAPVPRPSRPPPRTPSPRWSRRHSPRTEPPPPEAANVAYALVHVALATRRAMPR